MQIGSAFVEEDWYGFVVLSQAAAQLWNAVRGYFFAGPSEPDVIDAAVQKPFDACHQASGRGFRLI